MSTHDGRSAYTVDLTACFEFSIRSTVEGPPGLSRDEIEELIDADWMWISLDTDVLLESHWQLDSVEEHSAPTDPR